MKKILYLSIVDWNWIKQRPQIIAEELSNRYEVHFLSPKYYRNRTLTDNINTHPNLLLTHRVKIPFSARFRILKQLDNALSRLTSSGYIKKINPDIIYVSHPDDFSRTIRTSSKYVIYDCMDNYSAFESDENRRKALIDSEKRLCGRADCILVSSSYLMDKILGYGADRDKIHLVRNGYSGTVLPADCAVPEENVRKKHKIVYFGTVSSWFDFDLLLSALEKNKDIEFHIAGPLDKELPQDPGIVYDGIIRHELLHEYVKDCDALIMPFKINSIVEAVDPVKLYEYLNFNKPIISVCYKEVERFRDFVYFYSDEDSFLKSLDEAISTGLKYDDAHRIEFLESNSWNKRGNQIISIIEAEV